MDDDRAALLGAPGWGASGYGTGVGADAQQQQPPPPPLDEQPLYAAAHSHSHSHSHSHHHHHRRHGHGDDALSTEYAIYVRGLVRGYRPKCGACRKRNRNGNVSTAILKQLDMTVERGTIYGLLGPSGAGKTTLLKVLLGRLVPEAGVVRVLGDTPGTSRHSAVPGPNVGYMPQEIALYKELSVQETLRFHSRMHGMHSAEFKQRQTEVLEFLGLAGFEGRRVKTLSGGQQRRVSLACALLHNPDLIILDEPTVGVDPVLRYNIWQHLRELAKNGSTIVITTHYIDEARQADRVGLLRGGIILAEDNPEAIIRENGCDNLEDAFLRMCQAPALPPHHHSSAEHTAQMLGPSDPKHPLPPPVAINRPSAETPVVIESSSSHDMAAQWTTRVRDDSPWKHRERSCYCRPRCSILAAMFVRKFASLFKDVQLLLFVIVMPSLQIVLFGIAIGGDPYGVHISACNQDRGLFGVNLGGMILNQIHINDSASLITTTFPTPDLAIDAVRQGNAWAAIIIPENFTRTLPERFDSDHFGDPDIIRQSTFLIYPDMSNEQISLFVIEKIQEAFEAVLSSLVGDAASLPMKVETPVYGNLNPKFIDFLAPGIVTVIAFSYSTFLTAIAFVNERYDGTLDRVFAAGVHPSEVILGTLLTYLVILVIQVTSMLVVAIVGFGIPVRGPIEIVVFMSLMLGLAGMNYGLFVSSLATGEFQAVQIVFGTFFPVLLLSGILWPLEAIPLWLEWISRCFPTTWVADAFRSVMLRGWSIDHFDVWMGFVVTGIWLLLFLLLAILTMRRRS